MSYRLKNGLRNWPEPSLVQRVAESVAQTFEIPVAQVMGADCRRVSVRARREAWRIIRRQTGCSINGLAEVWGYDRKAIQRAERAGYA